MRFKVGDKVRIKSLDWYNKNKTVFEGTYFVSCDCGRGSFTDDMVKYCGEILTIKSVDPYYGCYFIKEDKECWLWTDEMIEGLVEEPVLSAPNITECVFIHEKDMKCTTEYILPEGYIFKDENGNVINATKIVLEKKKKEYPKTYEECCKVLNIAVRDLDILDNMLDTTEIIYSKNLDRLLNSFRKLLIYRDAYWKIAGDWKPEYPFNTARYVITNSRGFVGKVLVYNAAQNYILEFPTEEMRDAFYENFKEEIEICKELL